MDIPHDPLYLFTYHKGLCVSAHDRLSQGPGEILKQARSSNNRRQIKSDVSLDLLVDLAPIIEALGTQHFYKSLAASLASFLDSERYLAIRYTRFAKPDFLANAALTEQAKESYLLNYYRIDPVLRMVRDGDAEQVVTFDELNKIGADTHFYDEMYRTANIRDELVFLLPTIGGVWIAICIDRSKRYFSKKDIFRAKQIFPTINRLHTLHVNQSVFGRFDGYLNDSQIALMIVDADNTPRFRNNNWAKQIDSELEGVVFNMSSRGTQGSETLNKRMICHWEPLDQQHAISPGGKAIVVEQISPGYIDLTSDDLVERFAKTNDLTPREWQIVEQILKGQPAARIAEHLDVSVGTIRNHKHRLYYKLDITTERELFCMVFEFI